MSDNKTRVTGPSMFCATSVMKTPPARIGRISKDIVLPRSIELSKLLAGGVGVVFGLILATVVVGPSLNSLLYGAIIFGAAGVGIVTYSPIQGESLWKWLGLTVTARKNQIHVGDDLMGKVYIGVAPVLNVAQNERVRIIAGAVNVSPDTFDERGVLISKFAKALPSVIHNHGLGAEVKRFRLNSVSWTPTPIKSNPSFLRKD